MRRVVLKSPVLENCTPGSVRGALGNQRLYLAKEFRHRRERGGVKARTHLVFGTAFSRHTTGRVKE